MYMDVYGSLLFSILISRPDPEKKNRERSSKNLFLMNQSIIGEKIFVLRAVSKMCSNFEGEENFKESFQWKSLSLTIFRSAAWSSSQRKLLTSVCSKVSNVIINCLVEAHERRNRFYCNYVACRLKEALTMKMQTSLAPVAINHSIKREIIKISHFHLPSSVSCKQYIKQEYLHISLQPASDVYYSM